MPEPSHHQQKPRMIQPEQERLMRKNSSFQTPKKVPEVNLDIYGTNKKYTNYSKK
jgi:hypothetical protein